MKHKRLDEEMQKYVDATNGDVDQDFAKLDLSQFEHKKVEEVKKPSIYKIASVVVSIVIVIALAITLPLTLTDKTPTQPAIFYFDNDEVIQTKIESIDSIKSVFSNKAIFPKISFIQEVDYILNAEDKLLGASIDLLIFSDIDSVSGTILYDNIEWSVLEDFKTLEEKFNWNGVQVKYGMSVNELSLSSEYMIMFNANGFNHYYTITTCVEMEIGELLDTVFG